MYNSFWGNIDPLSPPTAVISTHRHCRRHHPPLPPQPATVATTHQSLQPATDSVATPTVTTIATTPLPTAADIHHHLHCHSSPLPHTTVTAIATRRGHHPPLPPHHLATAPTPTTTVTATHHHRRCHPLLPQAPPRTTDGHHCHAHHRYSSPPPPTTATSHQPQSPPPTTTTTHRKFYSLVFLAYQRIHGNTLFHSHMVTKHEMEW
ncbi:proline-rich receptor-like protein kinase PERK2 [Helianthus annuus]|uniref:proline-rich receptor-like protein kinase PERK2 n=1 Tax=Helianthus annuus TaxID=4232 RepID=UPI000B9086A4|nr:proline-rich receptor-like protein kinase PERK2 [Helianthus annuus]